MNKRLLLALPALMASTGFAADVDKCNPLDRISFQVTARQWINTHTAVVKVNINATLTNKNLVTARNDIMKNLSQIAKGDWHLTEFNRSQDSSGLEKLNVMAEARIDQSGLTGIYQQAKTVSQPGASYQIAAIDFKPSLEEIQQARASLREKLYHQVDNEISNINKNYQNQHYSLYQLSFSNGNAPVEPRLYKGRQLNTMAMAAAPSLEVSNELTMTAVAVAASNRTTGN